VIGKSDLGCCEIRSRVFVFEDARAMEGIRRCAGACMDRMRIRDPIIVFSFPSNTANSEHGTARDDIQNTCGERVGISQSHPSCCRAADLAIANPAKSVQGH